MKVCPICGKQYPGELPAKCDHCGYPSEKFKEYKSTPSNNFVKTTNTRTYSISDENAVRTGAGVIFALYIITGAIFITAGVLVIFGIQVNLGFQSSNIATLLVGVGLIIIGILIILFGWIIRGNIRIFANMSERLSSIDTKLG